MAGNLHKQFFKEYFAGDVDSNVIINRNKKLLEAPLVKIPAPISEEQGLERFRMKVLYPGLVTGVGLPHQENIAGEFKLGMHFDWTWGMPVVYGSSVKGVLRTYFPLEYKGKDVQKVMDEIFGSKEAGGADVFFDAVVCGAPKGHPLAEDAITPHRDVFAEPTPLPFLKIASGCQMEFRFKLSDAGLNKDEKKDLFKTILEKYGIGAKTNVGYGRLSRL